MGRFSLQFEDQVTPLRPEKDIAASISFIVRTTVTIIVLGCAISNIVVLVPGEREVAALLSAII